MISDVYKRQGVQTEAARGGRELVEADDEILHVLQLRDALILYCRNRLTSRPEQGSGLQKPSS